MDQWKNVTSCPTEKQKYIDRDREPGCGYGKEYHCILNQIGAPGEICIGRSWVQPGYCPEYNTVSKRVDVFPCKEERGACPPATYWSNTSFLYSGCNVQTMDGTESRDKLPTSVIAAVVVGLLLAIITAIVVTIFVFRRRLRKDKTFLTVDEREEIPLLSKDLLTKTREKGSYLIEGHQRDKTYIPTQSATKVKGVLDSRGIAVVRGQIGSGKTKTVLEAALTWMEDKKDSRKCFVFETLEEFKNVGWKDLKGCCIVLDGCFSRWAFDSTQTIMSEVCVNLYQFHQKNRESAILITIDRSVYLHHKTKLQNYALFKGTNIVDISLLNEERCQMLSKYLNINSNSTDECTLSENKVKDMVKETCMGYKDDTNQSIGFPSICVMFSKIPACKDEAKTFVKSCGPRLNEILKSMESSEKLAMFCINYAMLGFKEIDLGNYDIDEKCLQLLAANMKIQLLSKDELRKYLTSIDGTWLMRRPGEENKFVLLETAIFESCMKLWMKNEKNLLTQLCSPSLLKECIRGTQYKIVPGSGDCVYVVKEKRYEKLAERFKELLPTHPDLHYHPLVNDEKFVKFLKTKEENMEKESTSPTDPLQ